MQTGLVSAMRHGGRLADAMAAHPAAPSPWLDLSTGINPAPWRGPRASAAALASLPDPQRLAQLEAAAAQAFGVADAAQVVAVAGAEAGLRLLPRLLGLASADIVAPTYGGHEQAARAAGLTVQLIAADAMAASAAELLVVVNPNNPDGRLLPAETLTELASKRTGWTLVDESFVETTPQVSVASQAHERLIVLRSFGKFYGLAGVRLGFVIAGRNVAARLREALGDWPVCADAIAMGRQAYADAAWRRRTSISLERQAARLDRLLMKAGYRIEGGTSLFRLASAPDAQDRFQRLCEAGILTRPFAHRSDWLRFGLPPRGGWPRLETALLEHRP